MIPDSLGLTDVLLRLLLFTLPGVWANHVRFSISRLYIKHQEWEARLCFIAYSVASLLVFYGICLLGVTIAGWVWHEQLPYPDLRMTSVATSYLGIPVFPYVFVISTLLGILVGIGDNTMAQEKLFGWIRKQYGLKLDSRTDVWTEVVAGAKDCLARIRLSDGHIVFGSLDWASCKDEKRVLSILPSRGAKLLDSYLQTPGATYVDLESGYSIELFFPVQINTAITAYEKDHLAARGASPKKPARTSSHN